MSGADAWDRRIRRADALVTDGGAAATLLSFYARLLRQQQIVYQSFDRRPPRGSIETDASALADAASGLFKTVADHGPELLAAQARDLLASDASTWRHLLLDYWHMRSDRQFFAKALAQPYAEWLANTGAERIDREFNAVNNRCPRCGGAPQLSMLDAGATPAIDGSGRRLLCATCLTAWPFRRVLCPSCGEADEQKLGYFQSSTLEHVRLDACESCHRYLKTIDLGRLGLAVPLVDEVAAASLDLWAQEHGYQKIELNLLGV